MSVNIRSINNHLLADEKAREQISQLSKDVYDSINESTDALLNDVSVKKFSAGCPIVIEDPVANVAFASVKQKLTPKQEGSGDPYPAGGGKNLAHLINGRTENKDGLTFTFEDVNYFLVNGTATKTGNTNVAKNLELPAGQYTVSLYGANKLSSDTDRLYVIDTEGTVLINNILVGTPKTFTVTETKNVSIGFVYALGSTYSNQKICVQLEAGTTATEYQPYKNIRPIVPWTELSAVRAGKNLLDISKSTVTNGKFGEDGVFSANDKDTASRLDFKLQFYRDSKVVDAKYIVGATNNQRCTFKAVIPDGCTRIRFANNGSTAEFSIIMTDFLKAGATFSFSFDVLDATVGACKLSNFQLELGSTATPYEPFMAFDTYTDTLDEPMYGGERDWVKGEMVDEWGLYTLNGTENIWTAGTNGPGYQFQLNLSNVLANKSVNTMPMLKCSHYATNTPNNLYSRIQGITIGTNATISIYDKVRATYTVSEYKAYLAAQYSAGTPVQISYKLANPTTTQRTPQRITTIPGTNTIFGDGEFEIEWFKSTKKIAEERENLLLESFTDPLEAEGNPLVIKPVGGLPFDSVVTKFTPKQEGSGDPCPAGEGKNLLKVTATTQTVSGVTFTVNADGTIVANGTATAQIYFLVANKIPISAGTYVFNGCTDGSIQSYYQYIYSYGDDSYHTNATKEALITIDAVTEISAYIYIDNGYTVNNITFYSMLRIASETDATFAPYENIRPIVPWTELEMTRARKNLLDMDGWIEANSNIDSTKDGNKYTFNSGPFALYYNHFRFSDIDIPVTISAKISNISSVNARLELVNSAGRTVTAISANESTKTVNACEVRINWSTTGSFSIEEPMIRHASITDPTYEPYTADTYTDTLDEPMYGGERDWVNGEMVDEWETITLDGTEGWVLNSAHQFCLMRNYNTTSFGPSYCSHFKGSERGAYDGYINNAITINANAIWIYSKKFETVDELKTYLAEQYAAGPHVQVSFKKKSTTTTQRTAHNIPALVGVNTLYGDGTIAVKGRQSKTIDLEERIAALEAAVLLS